MALNRRFIFNDASWDGSCASSAQFLDCIKFCLDVQRELRRNGGGLEIGYSFLRGKIGFANSVEEALRALTQDQRRRIRLWLDREGPFWDRPQQHSAGEYFECQGDVVTDTSLAEAAHALSMQEEAVMVSLPLSKFTGDSLIVNWHEGPNGTLSFQITNVSTVQRLAEIIESALPDLQSYEDLMTFVQRDCRHLALIRDDILDQLGSTFLPAVAQRGREIFLALNDIIAAYHSSNEEKYQELCQKWLTSPRFSDSSTTEKNNPVFKLRMRFKHPCSGDLIYCYWHGKIRTADMRVHFEWPPPLIGRRLFVAYFGPKLTKT